ncbi:MAG: hypothetical protein K2M41_08495 [Muribaculaceae bacterium]|nr:hypothetical protein [Muribaculaceae bacterium]
MKNRFLSFILFFTALFSVSTASAQYYEIANQIPQLIRPALVGGFNYKGYVDAKYIKGIGNNNVDFLGFSTSQGFKYSNWFFMGAGIGVDIAFSHINGDYGNWVQPRPDEFRDATKTGVMIPIFTDFRFNVGAPTSTAFYADIKLGCSFLAGNYLQVNDGYLSSQQYFYFRPSVGVRIPLQGQNNNNGKKAFNIGVTYQLLTSNYWNAYYSNITLNGLGVDISYEW